MQRDARDGQGGWLDEEDRWWGREEAIYIYGTRKTPDFHDDDVDKDRERYNEVKACDGVEQMMHIGIALPCVDKPHHETFGHCPIIRTWRSPLPWRPG